MLPHKKEPYDENISIQFDLSNDYCSSEDTKENDESGITLINMVKENLILPKLQRHLIYL